MLNWRQVPNGDSRGKSKQTFGEDSENAIVGGIAAAYRDGVSMEIIAQVEPLLPVDVVETVSHFSARHW